MKQTRRLGTMILLTLIYALCFTAIKVGLPFLPPLLFGGLRALLGGIILLLVVPFIKQSVVPKPQEWKWIFWIGITTTITFLGMFLSPGRTGASIASILGNLSPLFTILLAISLLKEKLSPFGITALFLGLLGILFISYPDLFGKGSYGMVGIVLALAASGGAAGNNILVKFMGKTDAIIRISAWQLIIGSFPLLVFSYFTEQGNQLIWNSTSLGILIFLGVIGTAFTTAIWYMLIQHQNVGKLSLLLFLTPVFGLGIAGIQFKEPLHWNEQIGIGVIILATLLLIIDSLRVRPTHNIRSLKPNRKVDTIRSVTKIKIL